MIPRFRRPILAVLSLVALATSLVLSAGCSKSSTSPPAVTGPTFNFLFPGTGTSLSSPGTSVELVFTDVGSWDYNCSAHAACCNMKGTVVVNATTGADSAVVAVGQGGTFFVPSTVTIKPGKYVRWANVSAATNHTVTR